LRHAYASHALDHGAPIHLVQATLGHSSVATTTAYLPARPGDSSARFLAPETILHNSGQAALPSERPGVMDVMTAVNTAPGDRTMTSNNEQQTTIEQAAAPAKESKAGKAKGKAVAAPKRRHTAPGKGKSGKKATPAKKGTKAPKAAKGAKPAATRQGSKTDTVLTLLNRSEGATITELMTATDCQKHSVRGFLSGTVSKKMDLPLFSAKNDAGERVYRIEK
jgi:hypothetical protein